MKVLAKFKCERIVDYPEGENQGVTFRAVTNDCEENKSFAKFTPGGDIHMCVSYETPASTAFKEGQEYYVTFEECSGCAAGSGS